MRSGGVPGAMGVRTARQIIATLPVSDRADRVEYLDRGYSHDRKYVLWESGVPRYLLRLSGLALRERRRREFDLLARHRGHGVLCPEPLAVGVYEEDGCCYSLVEYLPGRDAEEVLPEIPEARQLAMGRAAGQQLRTMHEETLQGSDFDWPAHREAKYRRYLDEARRLGLTVAGMGAVEAYVEANLDLLKQAPVRFQHGDFHPANLIVQDGQLAGVIDFNRADWENPIEDFHKAPWFTIPVSVPFARG